MITDRLPHYQEQIAGGGVLKVAANTWGIHYYWPGPDLRYNGTLLWISGHEIHDYIHAWYENFACYESLVQSIPSGGDFTQPGLAGMTIRIGRLASGVCLRSYHHPVSNRTHLEEVVSAYRTSIDRAEQLQKVLANLS
ncbi:hypothetical protein [Blastococcus sp. SYSU D00813]